MAEPEIELDAHERYGLPLDFSGDGRTLATGGFDGNVSAWSVGEWTETTTVRAHEGSVNCGALTDGDALVTGSTDATLRVWDLSLQENVATLEGHEKTVADVAAHPTRQVVASASYDATVRIWNLETAGEPTTMTGHPRNVTSVAFVRDGAGVASGGIGDEVFVWSLDDASTVARLGGHGDACVGVTVDRDGSTWTASYAGVVYRWSTDDWSETSSFELPGDTTPNGIAAHPNEELLAVTRDGGVLLLDAGGNVVDEHETSIKGVYSPTWSPDGAWLAVGGADGTVRIYG